MVRNTTLALFVCLVLAGVGTSAAWANSAPVVSGVTAIQRADHSKVVDVSYTLTDADGDACTVTVKASSDGGATWTVPVTAISGACGNGITPGSGKHIVWNYGTDLPGAAGSQYRVRICADDGKAPSGMVLIPSGSFQMGDSFNESDSSELPVHPVDLSAYYMDTSEITNTQYAAALNWAYGQSGLITVTGGVVYKYNSGTSYPYCDTTTSSSYSRITWNGSTFGVVAGKENHPMVMVSWYGSVAYANWRSAMQGKPLCYDLSTWTCNFATAGYHLPTEAEWEKAARGGVSGHRYPWSNTDTIDHTRANYVGDPTFGTGAAPQTSPVKYFAPNGYGLYDMAGNAWEWCNDWFSATYYSTSPSSNPAGPESGSGRVVRSGGWNNTAFHCRCADHISSTPNYRHYGIGGRLALGSGGASGYCDSASFILTATPTVELWMLGVYADQGCTQLKNSFRPGDPVTVRLAAVNTGSPTGDFVVALNAFDSSYSWPDSIETSRFYNSHTTTPVQDQASSLAEGGSAEYVFTFTLSDTATPGYYRILAAARCAPFDTGVVLDTTGEAAATADWSDGAFKLGFTVEPDLMYRTRGVTVLVHGYWLPGDLPWKTPLDYWTKENVTALVAAYGGGAVWNYNRDTGDLDFGSWQPQFAFDGQDVVLFDWLAASNNWYSGEAEAAGEALFALLVQNGYVDLGHPQNSRQLQFIGHSRGCSVISETVQRLGVYGIPVDYVTYLDSHDWGEPGVPFDEYFWDPAVQVWSNVKYAQNYWQEASPDVVPSGRPLSHLQSVFPYNYELTRLPGFADNDSTAIGSAHSKVIDWYFGTVKPGSQRVGWYPDGTEAGATMFGRSGYIGGFSRWVYLGGFDRDFGSAQHDVGILQPADPNDLDPCNTQNTFYSYQPDGVDKDDDFAPIRFFNGDFDLADFDVVSPAGWGYHGGSVPSWYNWMVPLLRQCYEHTPSGPRYTLGIDRALYLTTDGRLNGDHKATITHNRFVWDPQYTHIRFDLYVAEAPAGSKLKVYSSSGGTKSFEIDLEDLVTQQKYVPQVKKMRDSGGDFLVGTLTFELDGDAQVYIDNIDLIDVASYYSLLINVQGQGATTPDAGSHIFAPGTVLSVAATPEPGWRFVRWEGDLSGNTNPASMVMDTVKTVTAVFLLPGDISGDGHVDLLDLLYMAGAWATVTGDPNYNAACDLNSDGVVNVIDLLYLADNWGK